MTNVTPITEARSVRIQALQAELDSITAQQSGMCLKLLRKFWPITGEEYLGFSANHRLMYSQLEKKANDIITELKKLQPDWPEFLLDEDDEAELEKDSIPTFEVQTRDR